MKTLSYSNTKYALRVPLIRITVEKIVHENFDFVRLLLSSFFFFFPSCRTQKVYDVYERSVHQTTALIPESILFLVRATCERRSVSYAPNYTSPTLFSICMHHFVRTYTHNSKTKGRIRTLYVSNDCSTIGDIYLPS